MAITRDLWIVLRARDEASRIIRSFGNNVAGASAAAATNMTAFERRMQSVAATLNQFAMTSMLVGTVMTGFGAAGVHFIKSAADVAAEYDRQARKTITQIDDVSVSLEQVADVGRKVAREVAIPFETMQDTLFFIFSSMDVNVQQAEALLRGFSKEAVAGQTSVEAAARSNIAILNALGLGVDQLSRIQDVQFQIVRKGVISYEELSTVIGRALPAVARSGQTFETAGAMIAFLTRNGLSAAMAATSAARALESFANPKVVSRLEDIGIKVRDAKGEFLPLLTVMEQMNKKLSKLAAPERAKFIQELFTGAGGTIQARRFWDVAFKNFGDFENMVGDMANATGVFENAYETMAGSVASQSVLIHNKWMLIKEALGKAVMPHLLQLISLLQEVLTWFDNLPGPTKTMIAQFILWGSVMLVVLGVLTILVGTLAFFVSGILAAGTALIGILAAIAALIVGFVTLTGAVYAAWKASENFRNILKDICDIVDDVKQEIIRLATSGKQAFEQHLKPALERLWNIIDTRVLPAIRRFVQIWIEEVFPKVKEAGRIISDIGEHVFTMFGQTIDNVIIPAIKKLTDWWERNSDAIRPFIAFAGQLVKWLLIIAAVLVAAPFVAFITAIAAIILGVYNLYQALKTLWNWIVTAFNATVEFFSNLSSTIVDFVVGIYNKVANFLQPLTDLIRAVFGLIMSIIKFFTVLAIEVIKDWVMPFVNLVVGGFKALWKMIVDVLTTVGNFIRSIFDGIFKDVQKAGSPIFDAVTKVWNDITTFFKNFIKISVDLFKDSGKWLFDAGKNIITGLINGITEKVKDLKEKLDNITKLIPKIKGPKAVDLQLLVPVGKNIMTGFMDGIDSQIPALKAQLSGLTEQIGQIPSPTITLPTPSFMQRQPAESKQIIQNITVNTQEISPRVHAEELGFELGNRL